MKKLKKPPWQNSSRFRSFLVGSIASNSLLGSEELERLFPDRKIKVFVVSWNVYENSSKVSRYRGNLLLSYRSLYLTSLITEEISMNSTIGTRNDVLYIRLSSVSLSVISEIYLNRIIIMRFLSSYQNLPRSLNDILLPEQVEFVPDVCVVVTQESSADKWVLFPTGGNLDSCWRKSSVSFNENPYERRWESILSLTKSRFPFVDKICRSSWIWHVLLLMYCRLLEIYEHWNPVVKVGFLCSWLLDLSVFFFFESQ